MARHCHAVDHGLDRGGIANIARAHRRAAGKIRIEFRLGFGQYLGPSAADRQPGAKLEKAPAHGFAEASAAAALKSCDNSRIDITKYKVITAKYNGKALIGGFDATGNPDPAGSNFCAKDRPDLNKCD